MDNVSRKLQNRTFLEQQIQLVESLPPFPLLASILRSFLQADDSGDIRPLVSCIEQEPSVCAKVLTVANSAFYGHQQPVKSVRDSVNRLGFTRLKSVIFSLIVSSKFDLKRCPEFKMSHFWSDAMLLAHASAHITDHLDVHIRLNRNEIYCIALLLNIGILFLVHTMPDEMSSIFKSADDENVTFKVQAYFGEVDHYTIGSQLLDHWLLPNEFVYTLGQINNPNYKGNCSEIIWIIKLARLMISNDFENIDNDNNYINKLCINTGKIESILYSCQNDLNWIKSFSSNF